MVIANDWNLIKKALEYYTGLGYIYKETPWIVPPSVTALTCPDAKKVLCSKKHSFVGSAEQGFIHLAQQGILERGQRYLSAGPCVRLGETDDLHQEQFFKVELFYLANEEENPSAVANVFLDNASLFFSQMSLIMPSTVEAENDPGVTDININGIEVGSYGTRSVDGITWAFGTGLAEPRFSLACANENNVDELHRGAFKAFHHYRREMRARGAVAENMEHDDEGTTHLNHLTWMCEHCIRDIQGSKSMSVDKYSRWLGFIQGCLISQGITTVKRERDRTRPWFNNIT